MSIYKVDTKIFKHAKWDNDWYVCPNCGYDSIDIGFNFCPDCGEGLSFHEDEAGE